MSEAEELLTLVSTAAAPVWRLALLLVVLRVLWRIGRRFLVIVGPREAAVAERWNSGTESGEEGVRELRSGLHWLGPMERLRPFAGGKTRVSVDSQMLDTPPQSLLLENGSLQATVDVKIQCAVCSLMDGSVFACTLPRLTPPSCITYLPYPYDTGFVQ